MKYGIFSCYTYRIKAISTATTYLKNALIPEFTVELETLVATSKAAGMSLKT